MDMQSCICQEAYPRLWTCRVVFAKKHTHGYGHAEAVGVSATQHQPKPSFECVCLQVLDAALFISWKSVHYVAYQSRARYVDACPQIVLRRVRLHQDHRVTRVKTRSHYFETNYLSTCGTSPHGWLMLGSWILQDQAQYRLPHELAGHQQPGPGQGPKGQGQGQGPKGPEKATFCRPANHTL